MVDPDLDAKDGFWLVEKNRRVTTTSRGILSRRDWSIVAPDNRGIAWQQGRNYRGTTWVITISIGVVNKPLDPFLFQVFSRRRGWQTSTFFWLLSSGRGAGRFFCSVIVEEIQLNWIFDFTLSLPFQRRCCIINDEIRQGVSRSIHGSFNRISVWNWRGGCFLSAVWWSIFHYERGIVAVFVEIWDVVTAAVRSIIWKNRTWFYTTRQMHQFKNDKSYTDNIARTPHPLC